MQNKILFSDLDETLLNHDKSISEENRNAIAKMLSQGHYFVVVTGRPIATGKTVIQELGLNMPGCYMIAFNGAVIYDCAAGRILAERKLPMDVVHDVFSEARREGIHVQTYQQDLILTEQHSKELDFYIGKAKMEYKLVADVSGHIETEPNKVILIDIDNDGRLEQFREEHREFENRCNCFFSCNEYLEYCPKNTDKGSGLKYISGFLNVPIENTVSVGDERNDISMIQAAHVGVAVKNAHSDLLAQADYITQNDNEHGAIAEVIEKFILEA